MYENTSRQCCTGFHDECSRSMRSCKCECHFVQASFDVLQGADSEPPAQWKEESYSTDVS